ncbi:hypothetical protein GCM10027159_28970 [Lysobacter terrae]
MCLAVAFLSASVAAEAPDTDRYKDSILAATHSSTAWKTVLRHAVFLHSIDASSFESQAARRTSVLAATPRGSLMNIDNTHIDSTHIDNRQLRVPAIRIIGGAQ